MSGEDLAQGVRAGNRRAIGRAISRAEERGEAGRALLAELHPHTGQAIVVGLTGPPGVGKSTMLSALVGHLRGEGSRVAIVSVDPSSPFTNGAVLGDRIRLVEHFLDPGVFIRSMASRGHQGGLSEATGDAILILDAAGYDVVLVETVGVGQNEVEVASLADTVALVLMPGSGDSIQAIKAGLMEIPDLIAINKADRPGADILRAEIESALTLVPQGPWPVPVLETVATTAEGVAELWETVLRHRAFLAEGDRMAQRRRDGFARQIRARASERLSRRLSAAAPDAVDRLAAAVARREISPGVAVDRLLSDIEAQR